MQHRLQPVLPVTLHYDRSARVEIYIQILCLSRADREASACNLPDGILIPVCVSDESCNACGVLEGSLVSIRQFATLPHLLLFTLALFGANTTRICWYVPGSISAEPSMARKHWFATPSKSTCSGLPFKPEARCIHPASLAEALALW